MDNNTRIGLVDCTYVCTDCGRRQRGNGYGPSPYCPDCKRLMVPEYMLEEIKQVRKDIEEITGQKVGKHRKGEIL